MIGGLWQAQVLPSALRLWRCFLCGLASVTRGDQAKRSSSHTLSTIENHTQRHTEKKKTTIGSVILNRKKLCNARAFFPTRQCEGKKKKKGECLNITICLDARSANKTLKLPTPASFHSAQALAAPLRFACIQHILQTQHHVFMCVDPLSLICPSVCLSV